MKSKFFLSVIILLNFVFLYVEAISRTPWIGYSQCDENKKCNGSNTVCVDGLCRCKANYHKINEQCIEFKCGNHEDCQDYDLGRICINGTCVCNINMFEENRYNGGDCAEKYCIYDEDCPEHRSSCVFNECKCNTNYKYNSTLLKCEHYYCEYYNQFYHQDCKDADPMSECAKNGLCVCENGTRALPDNGNRCVILSDTYNITCKDWWPCDHLTETCTNHQCQCSLNHVYNDTVGKCLKKLCRNEHDCLYFGKNMKCNKKGECECKDYFKNLNPDGSNCIPISKTFGKNCSRNRNICNESNQRCFDDSCVCYPDFSFNHELEICESVKCTPGDYRCDDIDPNRRCDSKGSCVCVEGYYENVSEGKKCTNSYSSFTINFSILFVTFFIHLFNF